MRPSKRVGKRSCRHSDKLAQSCDDIAENVALCLCGRVAETGNSQGYGPCMKALPLHPRCMARAIGLDAESQRLFKDEYLFEWEIPQRYVLHMVSLQTLHDRGFAMEPYMILDESIGVTYFNEDLLVGP